MNVLWAVVARVMGDLDPVGVDARRRRTWIYCLHYSKGRNWAWYLDCDDKFKPFGFEIHGFIAG